MPVPPATRISSRHHPLVQRCRSIARRAEDGVVLLDGPHVITEAIAAGVDVEFLLSDGRESGVERAAAEAGIAVHQVAATALGAASPVRAPTGVVALARWTPVEPEALFTAAPALVIGLCGVQDPGNVGSAIRAGDALGATGVAVLDESADPGGWKAVRGAMGSTFHLPVATGASGDVVRLARARGLQVAATVADDGVAVDAVDLRGATLVLLGREGSGLPAELIGQADVRVTIPMRPHVNSLNVAVTCALMLYEARRQRAGRA